MPLYCDQREHGVQGLAAADAACADAVWTPRSCISLCNRCLPLVDCGTPVGFATRRAYPPYLLARRERDVCRAQMAVFGRVPLCRQKGGLDGQGFAVAQSMFPVTIRTSLTVAAPAADRRLPLVDCGTPVGFATSRAYPPYLFAGRERDVCRAQMSVVVRMPFIGECRVFNGQGVAVTQGVFSITIRTSTTLDASTCDRRLPLVDRGTRWCGAARTQPPYLLAGRVRYVCWE